MNSLFRSFLQIAGAEPFSNFLNKKKLHQNKKRKKTIKKKITNKKKIFKKKITRKKKLKTRRNKEKTIRKKINKRTLKKKCKNNCQKIHYYTGKENSPKGLGYCPQCMPLRISMKGKDGNIWKIVKKSNKKKWIKVN